MPLKKWISNKLNAINADATNADTNATTNVDANATASTTVNATATTDTSFNDTLSNLSIETRPETDEANPNKPQPLPPSLPLLIPPSAPLLPIPLHDTSILSEPGSSTTLPYGDGSRKVFGMENFGNTCYCNSILQCLYYTHPFRQNVLKYPQTAPRPRKTNVEGSKPHAFTIALEKEREKEREAVEAKAKARRSSFFGGKKDTPNGGSLTTTISNLSSVILVALSDVLAPITVVGTTADPRANSDTRKKAALINGPILNVDHSLATAYAMQESLYTGLKDVFECMVENGSNLGVVSPSNLVEVLKRENELFSLTMHQDAHEFLNFLINAVIESVDEMKGEDLNWATDLFQGLITNQTKCHSCENISSRDEPCLDLSVDVETYSSITACLKDYSKQEILSQSNKFYCDSCQSYQEASKSMKLKRLPKVLTLHLKRFKYNETLQRNTKLFNTVSYPTDLRLFNTIDTIDGPDTLYELYACVVHIGGGPHQGHYVSLVKRTSNTWLLFDDELVELVDDNYVLKFFGPGPGLASAYVLFYRQVEDEEAFREAVLFNGTALEATFVPTMAQASRTNSAVDTRRSSVSRTLSRTATNEPQDLRRRASVNASNIKMGGGPLLSNQPSVSFTQRQLFDSISEQHGELGYGKYVSNGSVNGSLNTVPTDLPLFLNFEFSYGTPDERLSTSPGESLDPTRRVPPPPPPRRNGSAVGSITAPAAPAAPVAPVTQAAPIEIPAPAVIPTAPLAASVSNPFGEPVKKVGLRGLLGKSGQDDTKYSNGTSTASTGSASVVAQEKKKKRNIFGFKKS
ncbi:hypothetical protein BABINDRAFT_163332 [Babjeviella inositovora NRRL Y-12698]|uniref:ubiquitinyl hydrolase 1 n=1 Tax=Babjeviella inositovora NRRL Y-12698 TaxID=984486 RepID=A0A1E3QJG8_9ASCO|nr:uncharacterized protein BABINDRAFT_163332 [Babjeviella inositovora NRRL Y-12698]ODQ77604.1 hypothetical protein BABINDRAFT_163332 [Babjeviella inositovora NRRL Y-12698]